MINDGFKGFNYSELKLGSKDQIGGQKMTAKEAKENKTVNDYENGLSLNELKKIDANNDGVITEAEFKQTLTAAKFNSAQIADIWSSLKSNAGIESQNITPISGGDIYAREGLTANGDSVTTQTSGKSVIKTYFDKNGNVTAKSVYDGKKTTITNYDETGKITGRTETTETKGVKSVVAYDAAGKKQETTTYQKNADGNYVVTKKNASNKNISSFTALPYGRVISNTTYNYSGSTLKGSVTTEFSITDGSSTVTNKDSKGRETSIEHLDSKGQRTSLEEYSYTSTATTKTVTSQDGSKVETQYYKSNPNKLISKTETAADGSKTETKYYANQKVKSSVITSKDGSSVETNYNSNGTIKSKTEKDASGKVLQKIEYNSNGKETSRMQIINGKECKFSSYSTFSTMKAGANVLPKKVTINGTSYTMQYSANGVITKPSFLAGMSTSDIFV